MSIKQSCEVNTNVHVHWMNMKIWMNNEHLSVWTNMKIWMEDENFSVWTNIFSVEITEKSLKYIYKKIFSVGKNIKNKSVDNWKMSTNIYENIFV